MTPKLLGLHHVTATVDDAQADLDFCIELLGMRLVKKTVNFDNHNVYHFYYGTELGAPGTIWTTFPYKGYGVRVGSKGSGQVVATSFSVPAFSMAFWRDRLKTAKVRDRRARSAFRRRGDSLRRSLGVDRRADCLQARRTAAVDRRRRRRERSDPRHPQRHHAGQERRRNDRVHVQDARLSRLSSKAGKRTRMVAGTRCAGPLHRCRGGFLGQARHQRSRHRASRRDGDRDS